LFRSGIFDQLITTQPPAPPLDNPHFLTHAENHLKTTPVHTPFISLTSSLIWAIHKAQVKARESLDDPLIAVIDSRIAARHTVLDHAAHIRQQLKSLGRAPKYYNGSFEWLAWGGIGGEALIIGEFSLQSLHNLCHRSQEVADLLRIHLIDPDRSMTRIRHSLGLGNASSLTRELGIGIGILAKFICPSTHLHDLFVADITRVILQNWCISDDMQGWLTDRPFTEGIEHGLKSQDLTQLITPPSTPNPRRKADSSSTVCVNIPATPDSLRSDTTYSWTTPRRNAATTSNVRVIIPATPASLRLATTCRWTTPRVISEEPITPISPCSMFSFEPFESINDPRIAHTCVEGSREVRCPRPGEEWLHLPYGW